MDNSIQTVSPALKEQTPFDFHGAEILTVDFFLDLKNQ